LNKENYFEMSKDTKLNIAFAGGQCTGKSVVAAALFAKLKEFGLDYDLISEEKRKIFKEFGEYRSPFDRFYIWRQQEREELRSTASDGFITDSPLFHLYASAKMYSSESRDDLAVRELFRMCLEIKDRYSLIIMAENPTELPYKIDEVRCSGREKALENHRLIRTFVEHHYSDRLFLVKGNLNKRLETILEKIKLMGKELRELPY
jgi:nicotinamide riboside kinase